MQDRIESTIQTATDQLADFAVIALQMAVVFLIARLAIGLIRRLVWRRIDIQNVPASTYVLVNNSITVMVVIVAVTVLLAIWGATWASLLAALSVSTLAIVLGLQDLLKSVLGGAFIILERPFEVGDRIKVRDITGEVVDLNVRTTMLRNDEGVRVAIPNSVILTDPLTNFDEPLAAATLILVRGVEGMAVDVRTNLERAMSEEPVLSPAIRVTVEPGSRWRSIANIGDGSSWAPWSRQAGGPGSGPLRVRIILARDDPTRAIEREIVRRIKALYPTAEFEIRRGARS